MGISLLFSPSKQHTLTKILLHANLPQSHSFHRFHRIQWIFSPSISRNKKDKDKNNNNNNPILTSEMNFEEIKECLENVSGGTLGRPMIVNRGGQGSPSSSIELLSDDILIASPFGCTGTSPLF